MLLLLLQGDQSSIKTCAKIHCSNLSYSGGKRGRQESLSPGQTVTGWFLSGHWPDAGRRDSNQTLPQISGSTFFGRGTKRDLMGWTLGFLCLIVWGHPSVLCPGQQDFLGQRVSTEDTSVCHTKQKWDIMLSKRFTKREQINRNGNLKTTLLTWVKDEAITRVNCDFKGDLSKL